VSGHRIIGVIDPGTNVSSDNYDVNDNIAW
jgi:hypothetical protein